MTSAAGALHSHLVNARQVLPQLPSRTLYRALERTIAALTSYSKSKPEERSSALHLAERLEEFSSLYESYLSTQTGTAALQILRLAPDVLRQLDTARATLVEILAGIEPPQNLSDEEELFAIYFPGSQSLEDLAQKLRAIAKILQIIANLGEPTHPAQAPRVLHIESGSLLVKLAIAKWVASVARPWISALTGYYYRTRTTEGSLAASPVAAKTAIKHVLDVRQLLNRAGIETPDMDRKLEEAAAAMAENVAVLVQNQVRIKFDNDDFDQNAFGMPRLERPQPPQLPGQASDLSMPPRL